MLQRRTIVSLCRMSMRPCSASAHTPMHHASRTFSSTTHCNRVQLQQTRYLRPSPIRSFHITRSCLAQGPTADALMENLTDLYSTAKDEFEIAAEETEKKTVYAEEDREAAKEALNTLKAAYEKAVRESGPDVAKEVQSRTGPRIRELENAITAMEEMALEDH